MKKVIVILFMSLMAISMSVQAIVAHTSPHPYECFKTLLNGRHCQPWGSLYPVVDTIKDPHGVDRRPYQWYSEGVVTKTIVLHGIRFDFDKYNIRPDSYHILDENMSELDTNKQIYIHITGHTDNYGSDEYNQVLSVHRAQSVRDYFVSKGLNPDRITISGKGESQPIDTNSTDDGRFNNRRIEITITNQKMAGE